nr:hypothetical protein GCM10020092_053920 [Actinoplanes digitatis]
MKRAIVVLAGLAMLALGGCRNDEPAAAGGPEAAGAAEAAGGTEATPEAAPSPELTGSAELRCLIEGSPWHVSKPDLETQMQGLLRGIDVTGVHMTGDQTLTVTAGAQGDLHRRHHHDGHGGPERRVDHEGHSEAHRGRVRRVAGRRERAHPAGCVDRRHQD